MAPSLVAAPPAVSSAVETTGSWCAVRTHATREKTVAQMLADRGVPHFLPLERIRHVRAGRKPETVERPMYPTYLFAAFCNEYDRHEIRRTRYVSELVLTVTEHEQDRLASQIRSLERILAVDPTADATPWAGEPGRRVYVIDGPFMGAEGEIIRRSRRVKGHDIVRDVLCVGVLMLGRVVEVDIDPAFVEPM